MYFTFEAPQGAFWRFFGSFCCLSVIVLGLHAASLEAQAQHDLGIESISIGSLSGVYSDTQAVTVTVSYTNSITPWASFFGSQFRLEYRIDDGPIVAERANSLGFIFSGQTAQFTFANAPDLSQGMRTVHARVVADGFFDPNSANDMSSIMVESQAFPSSSVVVDTFPYMEDFEMGAGDWTAFAYGTAPGMADPIGFELGTPQNSPFGIEYGQLDAAASGVNAWKTNLTSPHYYSSNTLTQVISPVFDFRDIPYLEISLSVFFESNPGLDGASLQQSTDGGATWETVGAAGEPNNWYNQSDVDALKPSGNGHGWSGYVTAGSSAFGYISAATTPPTFNYTYSGSPDDLGSAIWLPAKNKLQGGALTQLRFVFNSMPAGHDAHGDYPQRFKDFGFAFDDIVISEGATADSTATLLADLNMDGFAGQGDTLRYSVVVSNTSSFDLSNVVLNDLLSDSFLSLVVGSVTTTAGAVVTGNTGGDDTVSVSIGALSSGSSETVTFDVIVGSVEMVAAQVCSQSKVSADEFGGFELPSDNPATMPAADPTCVGVNFDDGDGDGLPDGGDPDMDTLTNAQEKLLGTDPNKADSDNDMVNDNVEVAAGSDPLEPNSKAATPFTTACVDWNGFLANVLSQIFEHNNKSGSAISVDSQLRDIVGAVQSTTPLNLASRQQFDLIVNGLGGFMQDTYGTVCSTITSGSAGSLGGRLVSYRFTGTGSYTAAVVDPLAVGRTGEQYLSYNTYQPSQDPGDAMDFVASWIQVVNESPAAASGLLAFYDADGVFVKGVPVSLAQNGRIDIGAHELGANEIGLARWIPDSPTAVFRIKQVRYYFDGTASNLSDIVALNSVPAALGSGSILAAPFDTTGRIASVEISNVLASSVDVTITANSADGTPAGSPVMLTLAPLSTQHVVLNGLLGSGLGAVRVDAATTSSIIATLYNYGLTASQGISYSEGVPLSDGTGAVYTGSYNTFLNQECVLQIANRKDSTQSGTLDMVRLDGTNILTGSAVSVPANGATQVDLCSLDIDSTYGQITLTPTLPGAFAGVVRRQNAENTVNFSVPLE